MSTAVQAPGISPTQLTHPQLSPLGFWGDLAGTVAPVAGQALGSVFGNAQLGSQIGNTVGNLSKELAYANSHTGARFRLATGQQPWNETGLITVLR